MSNVQVFRRNIFGGAHNQEARECIAFVLCRLHIGYSIILGPVSWSRCNKRLKYSFLIYQSLEILITSEKLYPCHFGHLRRRGILKIFAHILCTDHGIVGAKMFMHAIVWVKNVVKILNYFMPSSILVDLDFKMSTVQRKETPWLLEAQCWWAKCSVTHFETFKGESNFQKKIWCLEE